MGGGADVTAAVAVGLAGHRVHLAATGRVLVAVCEATLADDLTLALGAARCPVGRKRAGLVAAAAVVGVDLGVGFAPIADSATTVGPSAVADFNTANARRALRGTVGGGADVTTTAAVREIVGGITAGSPTAEPAAKTLHPAGAAVSRIGLKVRGHTFLGGGTARAGGAVGVGEAGDALVGGQVAARRVSAAVAVSLAAGLAAVVRAIKKAILPRTAVVSRW